MTDKTVQIKITKKLLLRPTREVSFLEPNSEGFFTYKKLKFSREFLFFLHKILVKIRDPGFNSLGLQSRDLSPGWLFFLYKILVKSGNRDLIPLTLLTWLKNNEKTFSLSIYIYLDLSPGLLFFLYKILVKIRDPGSGI